MAVGLVLYGLILNFHKSWVGLAFGWILMGVGKVGSTVYVYPIFLSISQGLGAFTDTFRAITAFALEKYPDHSTSVSAIINMWRTCGGFSVSYYQPAWIKRNGAGIVFGIQAAVVSAATIITIVPVLVMGKRRAHQKPMEA